VRDVFVVRPARRRSRQFVATVSVIRSSDDMPLAFVPCVRELRVALILPRKVMWSMNHLLRCPVCEGVLLEPLAPSEGPIDDSVELASESLDTLMICPFCGTAIESAPIETVPASSPHELSVIESEQPSLDAPESEAETPDNVPSLDERWQHEPQTESEHPSQGESNETNVPWGSGLELELESPSDSNRDGDIPLDDSHALEDSPENSEPDEAYLPTEIETFQEPDDDGIPNLDGSASSWSQVAVRPRPRVRERSVLAKLIPPVLGGLSAIPIAVAILWYGFGKDIGSIGPTVSQYVPWIVPNHLRGRPTFKPSPPGNTSNDIRRRSRSSNGKQERPLPNINAGDFGTLGRPNSGRKESNEAMNDATVGQDEEVSTPNTATETPEPEADDDPPAEVILLQVEPKPAPPARPPTLENPSAEEFPAKDPLKTYPPQGLADE